MSSPDLIRELQTRVGVPVDGVYGPVTHAAVLKALAPAVPTDRFALCLAETLVHEGGWSDHPRDPGGATMKGVTLATYRAFKPGATKEDLRHISDADLKAIYRAGYWDKCRCYELPSGIDMMTFDVAVNSGPNRAAEWLQEALGVTVDKVIGPVTIQAARKADVRAVIDTLAKRRERFYRSLGTFTTFGKGWLRRLESVTKRAKEMAQ